MKIFLENSVLLLALWYDALFEKPDQRKLLKQKHQKKAELVGFEPKCVA